MLVTVVLVPALLCAGCGTVVAGQPSPADDLTASTISPAFVHGTDDGDTDRLAATIVTDVQDYWRQTFPTMFGGPWTNLAGGFYSIEMKRRGADRVVVRDGDAIGALLTRLGAHETVLAWEERRMRREVRATANRLANFDDANLRRSARAAVAAAAKVERALELLGPEAPEHLTSAGKLRLANRQASLEELGQLADPPMTKDAVAGRIRRLLAMADKRAKELGLPDTESAVTQEMLDVDA